MKNTSKLIIACFIFVLIVFGAVLYITQNKTSASTNPIIETDAKPTETVINDNTTPISTVPILMYHYIRDYHDPNDSIGTNLSVSPATFDSQMTYLSQNNYISISPSDLANKIKIPADKKPIIITFDDGYLDAYTSAYPILTKHNFFGVFYIITNNIGKGNFLTGEQIVELDSNKMIIGSHSKTHPDLTKISNNDINNQLIDSKQYLETLLSHSVSDLCYPSGKYNDDVTLLVKSTGYLTAVTTGPNIANILSNPLALPRLRIQNTTNLSGILK